jgi:uncharacterized membrane protein YfcA
MPELMAAIDFAAPIMLSTWTTLQSVAVGAGMLTAQVGSGLGDQVPPRMLLAAFAALMIVIAARMWRKAHDTVERMPDSLLSSSAGPTLARAFAVAILLVATFTIAKTLLGF